MSVFAKLVRRPFGVAAGAAIVAVLAQLSTGPATAVSTALATVTSADPYGAAVRADGASIYWRLNETSGGVVANDITGAANSGNYSSGVVVGEPGSPAAPAGTSFRFPGTSTQNVISNVAVVNPTVYSVETWFKTTTTSGGRLIGFGNSPTINSRNYDRHIYMLDDGRLRYGIYTGQNSYMTSPLGYNDGEWHHVVATQGSGGGRLYVDGVQVASGSAVTPEVYTGYWRLGTDKVWGNSTSTNFAGTLDEAAVYPSVLSAAAVANHYQLGITPPNAAPTASFTATPDDLRVAFNGTGSSDSDGTIAAYSWDFGDGTSGTGAQPSHTYSASGNYTVALTVTDNQGATGVITQVVTVTANAAPLAAFLSECTDLDCTFDATAATDPDGSIASYAWAFGDQGTGTGVSTSHSYAAGGSFDVTLTVTDNDGASNSVTQVVTVAARNNPPVAVPVLNCTDLNCSFDSTGSTDPDGQIVSQSWDFGDGETSAAATGVHRFAASGSYQVSLTVTDNRGASGTASVIVTVVDPLFAFDQFERTVTSGLGAADRGGNWTYTGVGTTAAVLGGSTQVTVDATRNAQLRLPDVTNLNTELNHVVWSVGAPTGGGIFVGSSVRITSTGNYRARLRLTATGSVIAQFVRAVGVSDTLIGSAATVSGVDYTPGMRLRVRTQALGSAPTTLRTKVWVDGTPEPSGWTLSVTDSTAGYQTAGSIGLWAFASGTSSTATVRFDDLSAVIVPAAN